MSRTISADWPSGHDEAADSSLTRTGPIPTAFLPDASLMENSQLRHRVVDISSVADQSAGLSSVDGDATPATEQPTERTLEQGVFGEVVRREIPMSYRRQIAGVWSADHCELGVRREFTR